MSGDGSTRDRVGVRYTRWGVVAAGGGGGRIASEFLFADDMPGVEDRVVIMNTHPSDIRRAIEQFDDRARNVEETLQSHAFTFGSRDGAGNKFQHGRECAEEDVDVIVRQLSNSVAASNALLYVSTLGGGTGNGSIPYLIRQLSGDLDDDLRQGWMDGVKHLSMAVWPFASESPHRQFNAVCGLSRHLLTPQGTQNADMTILVSNEHLNRSIEGYDDSEENQNRERVNRMIPAAVNLMTAAGREADEVIDVEDYVSQPSDLGVFNFTFALTEDNPSPAIGPRTLFELASEQTYVPLDIETCRAVFGVIRAPREEVDDRTLTAASATAALDDWRRDMGIDSTGDATVIPRRDGKQTRDALLLLGGFDLDQLLAGSLDDYEAYKERIQAAQMLQSGNDETIEEVERLERNLRLYRKQNSSAPGDDRLSMGVTEP
jgi:cell division GTPase FtsZ